MKIRSLGIPLRNTTLQGAVSDFTKDSERMNYWHCQKNKSLSFNMPTLAETPKKDVSFVIGYDQKARHLFLLERI